MSLNDLAKQNSDLASNPFLRGLDLGKPKKSKKAKTPTATCKREENEWIVQLLKDKQAKVSSSSHCNAKWMYTKAIKNVKLTPFTISNEQTAQAVDGVGPSIAKLIKTNFVRRNQYASEASHESLPRPAAHRARTE